MQRRLGRTGQTNGNDSTADAKGRARPREDSGPLAGEGRAQPRARVGGEPRACLAAECASTENEGNSYCLVSGSR